MVCLLKPGLMSRAGTLQRRTTYLISLTLVKVEAVGDDGAQPARGGASGRGAGGGDLVVGGAPGDEAWPLSARRDEEEDTELEEEEDESLSEPRRQRIKPERGQRLPAGAPSDRTPSEVCPGARVEPAGRESAPSSALVKDTSARSREGVDEVDTEREETLETCRGTPKLRRVADGADPTRTPTKSNIPVRIGQRPGALLKAHSDAVSRRELKEAKEAIPTSAKGLDHKNGGAGARSPASPVTSHSRASWAEEEKKARPHLEEGGAKDGSRAAGGGAVGGAMTGRAIGSGTVGGAVEREALGDVALGGESLGVGAVIRDSPRSERLKAGSASLPAPLTLVPKPPRKGKSRTLDNSDLHSLSEDLRRGVDGLGSSGPAPALLQGQAQRASARDRKMLKFISGIFAKSTPGPASAATAPPLHSSMQRESSEEDAACALSQEWTLTRAVSELRLGVLGSLRSGKSALVHKYITGSYLPLESQEGARYKKEVLVEGQSHLLLIREETDPPDAQFCSWVDAVILVFSLENEASFQEVYKHYSGLCAHRNVAEIPVIVVGTQDKISSTNPRVIEDARARQLCSDVRRCSYYETCATYGLNVDRVFTEAAQRIATIKKQAALLAPCKSLPSSPSHSGASTPVSGAFPGQASNGGQSSDYSSSLPSTPVVSHKEMGRGGFGGDAGGTATPGPLRNVPRRRTSLFANRRGSDSEKRVVESKVDPGTARGTAIKQSILWKRSGSSLNKEWKKKCVTLSSNGMLSYHSSVNDYLQNAHGKEMDLLRVTVKVPGKRPPRAVPPCSPSPGLNGVVKDVPGTEGAGAASSFPASLLTVDEGGGGGLSPQGDRGVKRCPSSLSSKAQSVDSAIEAVASPPAAKDQAPPSPATDRKKHRRKKSMNQKGDLAIGQAEEEENSDFIIVSSTGQRWHFEAQSMEERDAWVQAIESQILASLQSCESSRNKARRTSQSEAVALQAIRNARGNGLCVDCGASNPTWASLNLGALICIECSGIHRNLGTHLSRVRSLDLDDWPRELTLVLTAIGNHMANSVWESRTLGRHKPTPDATREERESWIRAKYEQRVFVAPLPAPPEGTEAAMSARLLSAVIQRDLPGLLLLLAHSTKEEINAAPPTPPAGTPPHTRTALHAACQLGDVVMTQLLVWYGSDVKARDSSGQTALTLARNTGSQECVDILLQHGCPNETPPAISTPSLPRKGSTTSLGRANSRRGVS